MERERRLRDRALFDLAIDSKLRGCDIVSLKVEDVAPHRYTVDRATIRQRKTGRPVRFEITEQTRARAGCSRSSSFFVVAPFAAAVSAALAGLLLRAERRILPRLGCELLLVARRPLSDTMIRSSTTFRTGRSGAGSGEAFVFMRAASRTPMTPLLSRIERISGYQGAMEVPVWSG